MSFGTYRALEEYSQEFRSESIFLRIFKVINEGFKHLNVYLILVQKFSKYFISIDKTVEIFGNFLKITH